MHVPLDYKESDPKIFEVLFKRVTPIPLGMTPRSSIGLVFHEKKFVGKYEIQPIELKDYSTGKELLDWFNANGFKTKNKDIGYYLKHHYAYLAIKINDLNDKKIELKPLHIIYKSNELSVPLKFDSLSGVFDVNLYFLTQKKITDLQMFDSKQLSLDGEWAFLTPIEFDPIKAGLEKENLPKGYLYQFKGKAINSTYNQLKDWTEDPSIKIE